MLPPLPADSPASPTSVLDKRFDNFSLLYKQVADYSTFNPDDYFDDDDDSEPSTSTRSSELGLDIVVNPGIDDDTVPPGRWKEGDQPTKRRPSTAKSPTFDDYGVFDPDDLLKDTVSTTSDKKGNVDIVVNLSSSTRPDDNTVPPGGWNDTKPSRSLPLPRRRKKKRVRFLFSRSTNSDKLDVYHCSDLQSHYPAKDSWWNKSELQAFKKRELLLSRSFLREHLPTYQAAVDVLYRNCALGVSFPHDDNDDNDALIDTLSSVVHHDCRGLEKFLISRLHLQSAPLFRTVKSKVNVLVLQTQTQWQQIPGLTINQRQQLLATGLQPYTTFASNVARWLAEGDRRVCSGDYPESHLLQAPPVESDSEQLWI